MAEGDSFLLLARPVSLRCSPSHEEGLPRKARRLEQAGEAPQGRAPGQERWCTSLGARSLADHRERPQGAEEVQAEAAPVRVRKDRGKQEREERAPTSQGLGLWWSRARGQSCRLQAERPLGSAPTRPRAAAGRATGFAAGRARWRAGGGDGRWC